MNDPSDSSTADRAASTDEETIELLEYLADTDLRIADRCRGALEHLREE